MGKYVLISVALIILGCGTEPQATPPIQHTLSWDTTTEPNVTEYHVYIAQYSSPSQLLVIVPYDPTLARHEVRIPALAQCYYVTAASVPNSESEPSEVVCLEL